MAASWLQAEVARLDGAPTRPWLVLRRLAASPWTGVLLCAVVLAGLLPLFDAASDAPYFVEAARRLLSRDAWSTYDDAALQSGPLYLLLTGLGAVLGDLLHLPPSLLGGALLGAAAAVAASLALPPGTPRERVVALQASLVATGPLVAAGFAGHVDDLLVALLLLVAGRWAGRHPARAGLAFAAAVDVKLWAVLGVVVLLGARDAEALRRALRAGVVAGAAVLASYLPFFLLGDARTFDFAWVVAQGSPASLLVDVGEPVGWGLRAVQGCLVVVAAAVVWVRAPGLPQLVAAVVAARLLLEPRPYAYYWTALAVVVLVAAWSSRRPGPGVVAALALSTVPWWLGGDVLAVTQVLTCLAVLTWAARPSTRPQGAT